MAGIEIKIHAVPTGETPYAVLQQSSGGLGLVWNVVSGAWQASPPANDRKVTLAQDSEIPSSWDGSTVSLSTYTGFVSVHFFDSSDNSLGTVETEVATGDETFADAQEAKQDTIISDIAAIQSGGDATEAKQDQIITAIGNLGGVSGLSPNIVDNSRTWKLPDSIETGLSPQVVTLGENELVTLAMDFREKLNKQTGISSVVAVDDDLSLLTFANQLVDQSFKLAHFDITAGLVNGSLHTITVRVTTTDGQTIQGKGVIEVVA